MIEVSYLLFWVKELYRREMANKTNLPVLYRMSSANINNPAMANITRPLPPLPHELLNVNPGIPVFIEKPRVPIAPDFPRTLAETPDLLTFNPTPLPRLTRF